MPRERDPVALPLVGTLLVHGLLGAGLQAAGRMVKLGLPPAPMEVTFEVKRTPPPPPEPPAPPPPPPPVAAPAPVPPPTRRRVASVRKPPRRAQVAPAPGPPSDEPPAPQRIYVLPGEGSMAVSPGPPEGTATGVPGGTGHGTGGGAEPGAQGSGPRVVPLSSVTSMPEALGDYDYSKDYPPRALQLGLKGNVLVRLLVDEQGRVAETKLLRGLGGGLSEKALQLARRLRFKPARDASGRPVATWITWTFRFTPPR